MGILIFNKAATAILLLSLISLLFSSGSADSSAPPLSSSLLSDYHEQLVLRPLPLAALLASFNFRTNISLSDFDGQNFRLFPRSLGQILQYAETRELHLRFALGRWDTESWGARPWDGRKEGGTGVEIWAWLDAETDEEADQKWLILTNALSGLFCASLNFIDSTRTTRPVMSFQPEGDHPNSTLASTHLLHGTLPHEVVCTENLTPFLKLLPCKGKAGISSLLDGHKLFDASWQSMAIDVRPVCPPEGECVLEAEQTIDMVLDIDRSKRPRGKTIPRLPPAHELRCDTSKPYHSAEACYPVDYYSLGQDWTLSQVFGKALKGTCPLTDPAIPPVCLHVPASRVIYTSAGAREVNDLGGSKRCYHLDEPATELEIGLPPIQQQQQQQQYQQQKEKGDGDGQPSPSDTSQHAPESELVKGETPLLYAERSFTGHGQERGGVQAILRNPSLEEVVEFVYMESLPWFMRMYLHTLEARINSHQHEVPQQDASSYDYNESLIKKIYYRPAVDRKRGTQLELLVSIPPASTVFLTYDFEKTILRYTEYPPDANRGFDVAASVITILGPPTRNNDANSSGDGSIKCGRHRQRRIPVGMMRTTSLLLNLPTPDFSMPYNVIIFTSTTIALAFGGLFNILVRRFVAADEGPDFSVERLRNMLVAAWRTVVERVERKKEERKRFVEKGKEE